MPRNPILEEIYAARDKLLADCHGDVHAYVEEARQRALASGRPIATPKQRTKRCTGAADQGTSKIEGELAAAR
jgi:hypothetical protein